MTRGASGEGTNAPRCCETLNARPSSACAAVAPRQTITRGLVNAISVSSQGRHAAISAPFGLAWMRRLPRGSHLKCFTTLVRYTRARSIPASVERAIEQLSGGTDERVPGHVFRRRRAAPQPSSPSVGRVPRRTRSAWPACRDRRRGSHRPRLERVFSVGRERNEIGDGTAGIGCLRLATSFGFGGGLRYAVVSLSGSAHRVRVSRAPRRRAPPRADRRTTARAFCKARQPGLVAGRARRRRRRCAAAASAPRASSRSPSGRAAESASASATGPPATSVEHRARQPRRSRWSIRPLPGGSTDTLPDRCRSRRRARPLRRGCARESRPRTSMVRYDRQRVESSTCDATSAPVGQASRHSLHEPH